MQEESIACQAEILRPRHKLDLGYFTEAGWCPFMVRRGARGAFELFLHLARRFLAGDGERVPVDYEAMCDACGLDPGGVHSRSRVSRLLRSLRTIYGVIDYEPLQRRRPRVRLAAARPGADVLNPRHYVYFEGGWNGRRRAVFDALGPRAFAAEYMFWIARYESALAWVKHGRAYWFFPLEELSRVFHVSVQFAGAGLRGLVELGVLRVVYGQFGLRAPNDEFGAANRYYFEGLEGSIRRQREFQGLQEEYGKVFKTSAVALANGQTVKNVRGLCELIRAYGKAKVRRAIEEVAALPARSLMRRLAYVSALLSGAADGGED